VKSNTPTSKQEDSSKLDSTKKKKMDKTLIHPSTIINNKSAKAVSKNEEEERPKNSLKKMSYSELAKVRVIQKNLVYVIGLAPQIAHENILTKSEYFGQYGKITKIVVNKGNAYNPDGPNGPSFSAYITFSNDIEASTAILAIDQFYVHERVIRASYGTTKYCTYFLKEQSCPNSECLYLHSIGKDRDSFFKVDDILSNKNIFLDQQKLAVQHLQKHLPVLLKAVAAAAASKKKVVAVFPDKTSIATKVQQYLPAEEAAYLKAKYNEPPDEPVEPKKPVLTKIQYVSTTSNSQKGTDRSPISALEETKEPKHSPKDESSRSSCSTQSTSLSANEELQFPSKKEIDSDLKEELKKDNASVTTEASQSDIATKKEDISLKLGSSTDFRVESPPPKVSDDKICSPDAKADSISDRETKKEDSFMESPIHNSIKDGNLLDQSEKQNLHYNNDYDKKIIESLLTLINKTCDHRNSRFPFAQVKESNVGSSGNNSGHKMNEPSAEPAATETEYEEFTNISKSIQEYVLQIKPASAQHFTFSDTSNPSQTPPDSKLEFNVTNGKFNTTHSTKNLFNKDEGGHNKFFRENYENFLDLEKLSNATPALNWTSVDDDHKPQQFSSKGDTGFGNAPGQCFPHSYSLFDNLDSPLNTEYSAFFGAKPPNNSRPAPNTNSAKTNNNNNNNNNNTNNSNKQSNMNINCGTSTRTMGNIIITNNNYNFSVTNNVNLNNTFYEFKNYK
jgi:hypothetical protein